MHMHIAQPTKILVHGRRLAYTDDGPPRPRGTILLLPGLASNRLGWLKQIPAFSQEYRTIALDHRDCGGSDRATGPYSIADLAGDAAALLALLQVRRTHVVGISMGGFVALEMAVRYPECVDHLVLTSTSAGGTTQVRPRLALLAGFVRPSQGKVGQQAGAIYTRIMAPGYAASHPDEIELIAAIARYHPQSMQAFRRQLLACLLHDIAGGLREIHAPTLVLHGGVDPLIPLANGVYLARHIRGARLVVYPESGHVLVLECAAEYNRAVLDFLDRAPISPSPDSANPEQVTESGVLE